MGSALAALRGPGTTSRKMTLISVDASKLTFPKHVVVTDQVIDTSTLELKKRKAFIGLFQHVLELYQAAGVPRYIVGLVGPTGSGKSVIASLFDDFASQLALPFRFASLGIDAYHFPNAYLNAHTIDGAVMKTFKGRYDTYDAAKLARSLIAFRAGQTIRFPVYSRAAHDPVEDMIDLSEENVLLLLEGLWLLHESPEWEQVRSLIDHSIFIEASKDEVRPAVIKRHVEGGRSVDDASNYYGTVDANNFDLIMKTKGRAHEIIQSYFFAQARARDDL
jgi:putative kinase